VCLTRGVLDSVRASVSASVRDYWWGFGQYEASWLSYYDFMSVVLGQETDRLAGNEILCKEAGWSILFWELALLSEKPTQIHRNERGQLHKDGALALAHSDGWGIYALNGVRMKAEHILTPAKDLPPKTILAETNADIRRELIRKVGVERMLVALPHKRMEKRGDYELLSVELSGDLKDARYLKMLNPSIGTWHLEGVAPECDTVEKSLNWRNQNFHTNAEILT